MKLHTTVSVVNREKFTRVNESDLSGSSAILYCKTSEQRRRNEIGMNLNSGVLSWCASLEPVGAVPMGKIYKIYCISR
jgi:hypothetical protein